jgi:hypothetical protein
VDFVGYGRIPGLRADAQLAAASEVTEPAEPPTEIAKSSATPKPPNKSSGKKSKARK